VRSALLAVDGVRRARVSLETRDALVTYDPAVARVDALIDAVRKAEGFSPYDAAVKVAPRTGEP
jgi:copper chaperone CopZ